MARSLAQDYYTLVSGSDERLEQQFLLGSQYVRYALETRVVDP